MNRLLSLVDILRTVYRIKSEDAEERTETTDVPEKTPYFR